MDLQIGILLLQDGIVNGAVYAIVAVSLILTFTVSRIVFLPQGEFVMYGAMTFGCIQKGVFPGTIWILVGTGLLLGAKGVYADISSRRLQESVRSIANVLYPLGLAWIFYWLDASKLSYGLQVLLTLAIVTPLGFHLYKLVFQPLADSSLLVLLIAAVALHLMMVGGGLLIFGPDGMRTTPWVTKSFDFWGLIIPGQSVVVVAASIALTAILFVLFNFSLRGKALRATAFNRNGARLVGVRPEVAGSVCLTLAAFVGAVSGVLISPVTTFYYDTGFLIVLKGFVAATIGAFVSYPAAIGGAALVGIVEAFSSFWASSFKESILFMLILPVLLWLSLSSRRGAVD